MTNLKGWLFTFLCAALPAAESAADGGAPPPSPSGRVKVGAKSAGCLGKVVNVDLARFRRCFSTELSPAEEQADLRLLGLVSMGRVECPASAPVSAAPGASRESTLALDSFRRPLFAADSADWVIQVRGTLCGASILDGVALHPLGPANLYCALPLPFLPGFLASSQPTTVTFSFANLTDAKRVTVRVQRTASEPHTDESSTAYWDVQGGRFVEVFQVEASSGSYMTGTRMGSEDQSFKLSTSGAPPQVITLRQQAKSCSSGEVTLPSGETVPDDSGQEHCSEAHSSEDYVYCPPVDAEGLAGDGTEVWYDREKPRLGSYVLKSRGCAGLTRVK